MPASNKLTAYVGFSIKARKVVYGYDNVLVSRRVMLVIAIEDINRTAKSELVDHCLSHNIPLEWTDAETMEACVHRAGCKCIGLTDASLSRAAQAELARIRRGSNE